MCKLDYKNNTNNDFKIGLFAGTINLNLVKYAGMHGFNAIGLHYTDGDTLVFNSEHIQDFLFFKNNSLKLIHYLFKSNMIPIISSTGITKNHILINIDSDVIAALLAQELQVCLIMLTDVGGVLNGEGHIIKTMNYNMYHQLMLDGIINEGMMIKVNAEL
ncbi:hypothetical protein RJT52_00200 [Buchnera aphidicola (Takecallis taiwana)]|uniref:amino acid kinase family protein n=1 Tax=Buchnera aphidicola TaxID=9 RepID=UPI0031B83B6A